MQEVEKNFYVTCQKFNNAEDNDYRGELLYKVFLENKFGEELLASYVVPKQKFDCLYGFLLTKSRIIEINSYSTMYTISSKKFKYIKRVVLEKEFDDKQIEGIINNQEYPERVQFKVNFLDHANEIEEIAWEDISEKDNIIQAVQFANKLVQLQSEIN